MKDLDAFEEEYTKIEKEEAEEDVVKKGMGMNVKGVPRSAPRNTTKKTANASKTTDSDDQDYVSEVAKLKARGCPKKAPATLPQTSAESDDDDDEILELKDRLAKYNLNSFPDQTAMEVEDAKEEPKKSQRRKHQVRGLPLLPRKLRSSLKSWMMMKRMTLCRQFWKMKMRTKIFLHQKARKEVEERSRPRLKWVLQQLALERSWCTEQGFRS